MKLLTLFISCFSAIVFAATSREEAIEEIQTEQKQAQKKLASLDLPTLKKDREVFARLTQAIKNLEITRSTWIAGLPEDSSHSRFTETRKQFCDESAQTGSGLINFRRSVDELYKSIADASQTTKEYFFSYFKEIELVEEDFKKACSATNARAFLEWLGENTVGRFYSDTPSVRRNFRYGVGWGLLKAGLEKIHGAMGNMDKLIETRSKPASNPPEKKPDGARAVVPQPPPPKALVLPNQKSAPRVVPAR